MWTYDSYHNIAYKLVARKEAGLLLSESDRKEVNRLITCADEDYSWLSSVTNTPSERLEIFGSIIRGDAPEEVLGVTVLGDIAYRIEVGLCSVKCFMMSEVTFQRCFRIKDIEYGMLVQYVEQMARDAAHFWCRKANPLPC